MYETLVSRGRYSLWAFDNKIFISCRLGFGVRFGWPEGYPRLSLVLWSPDDFCNLFSACFLQIYIGVMAVFDIKVVELVGLFS